MKCPFCSFENLQGADECGRCGEDLTAFEGVRPKNNLERSIVKDPVERLKSHEAVKVSSEASIRQVVELLHSHNHPVLVMEGEQLLGIVTERDILFRVVGREISLDRPVREIMTPDPETLSVTDKVAFALNRMAVGGFRHIPILKEGRPEGVIGVRDVLAYLAEMFPKTKRVKK